MTERTQLRTLVEGYPTVATSGSSATERCVVQVVQAFVRNPEYGGPIHSVKCVADLFIEFEWTIFLVSSWRRRPGVDPPTRMSVFSLEGAYPVLYLGYALSYRWTTIDLYGWRQVYDLLQRSTIVIIHGYRGWTGSIATVLGMWLGKDVWLYPHGMIGVKHRSILAKRCFDATIGGWMLRRYKKVIVASELEVQEAIYGGVAPDRIVSTSPHVDSVDRDEIPSGEFRRRVGIASHQVVVLFLGRLVPIKNLELMIEVLRRLPEPYVFVAVGPEEDPGYVTRLRMLAGECGVEDRFRIVGAAYGRSKWEAMADCNVLVLCSHSENLGVAALEAISFGLPVVVGDTCGVSERVKPGQGVVVPLDAEAFRNLLKNALQTQIARFQPTRSSIESIGCG